MKKTVTVFRGDGIGPELVDSVLKILEAAGAPLDYELFDVGENEFLFIFSAPIVPNTVPAS